MARLLSVAAACVAVATPLQAVARDGPGYAAILVDADTREVLYANGADLPRHPASITKMMTLYLAFEALSTGQLRLDDQLVMSRHAVSQQPSHLGLGVGKTIRIDDALRVIAVKSANDLAVALAEKLGGTEDAFAGMMTRKARALGMHNTVFVNATGLPDAAHITTARDIAILAEALIHTYPKFYTLFSTQKFQYEKQVFANHNHLLGRMPGMDGIKTGYTVDAGFTLAASAIRNNRRLIAVVLGEPTAAARDRDVTALMDTGFTVETGRAMGQQVSVAGMLAPLAHPAVRIGLPMIEQGSSDDDDDVTPARAPAPRERATTHVAVRAKAPASARHGATLAAKDESTGTKTSTHKSELASSKPGHGTIAGGRHGKASKQELADAHATKLKAKPGKSTKKSVSQEADASTTKKHVHKG